MRRKESGQLSRMEYYRKRSSRYIIVGTYRREEILCIGRALFVSAAFFFRSAHVFMSDQC